MVVGEVMCYGGEHLQRYYFLFCFVFFFFKQKTAYEIYQCDWSSDVCSSDLASDSKIYSSCDSGSNWKILDPQIGKREVSIIILNNDKIIIGTRH